jgi:hypothetical protein
VEFLTAVRTEVRLGGGLVKLRIGRGIWQAVVASSV